MAKLNIEAFIALDNEFSRTLDGKEPINLSNSFGAQVGNNFDQAANEISMGMSLQ